MSPSFVTIDTSPDLDLPTGGPVQPPRHAASTGRRTLLLGPPSISAHEQTVHEIFDAHGRPSTDLHMLDRLSSGLVSLPPATYDLVLVLTLSDGSLRPEALPLLSRHVFASIVPAMKPGARLAAQDGRAIAEREAVLAGLVEETGGQGGFTKPEYEEEVAVPLRFGKKKVGLGGGGGANGEQKETAAGSAPPVVKATPPGVGFIDLDDDLGEYESGDELIDENDIMTEEERNRPIQKREFASLDCQPHDICRLTNMYKNSPGLPARPEEGLQGLHLRPCCPAGEGGQGEEAEGRQQLAGPQARLRRPHRAGLYRQGQDGLVQLVLAW